MASSGGGGDHNFNIPDADLTGVKVPRNGTGICKSFCVATAFVAGVAKEALMFCTLDPAVSFAMGSAAGAAAGVGSIGYGAYSGTSEALRCQADCDKRLNPPLSGGYSYK